MKPRCRAFSRLGWLPTGDLQVEELTVVWRFESATFRVKRHDVDYMITIGLLLLGTFYMIKTNISLSRASTARQQHTILQLFLWPAEEVKFFGFLLSHSLSLLQITSYLWFLVGNAMRHRNKIEILSFSLSYFTTKTHKERLDFLFWKVDRLHRSPQNCLS